MRAQNLLSARQPANAHRRVLCVRCLNCQSVVLFFNFLSSYNLKRKKNEKAIVKSNTSIMEICFLISEKSLTRLYVLDGNKYLGMINSFEILKKLQKRKKNPSPCTRSVISIPFGAIKRHLYHL